MITPQFPSVRHCLTLSDALPSVLSGVIVAGLIGGFSLQPLQAQPPQTNAKSSAANATDETPSDGAEGSDIITSTAEQVDRTARSVGTRAISTITGEGTAGKIAKFTGPNQIGDSIITESAGSIGIGTATPPSRLTVIGGGAITIQGDNLSTAINAVGIQGRITSAAPGTGSAGVRGINNSTSGSGSGVYGSHAGSGFGVYGFSPSGRGLYGLSTSGYGVLGSSTSGYGVYGLHIGTTGTKPGVYGRTSSTDAGAIGVHGVVNAPTAGADSAGVRGDNTGTNSNGSGVFGSHAGSGSGIYGTAPSGYGVSGNSSGGIGIYGNSTSNVGVYGNSDSSRGVFGQSNTGNAVEGRVITSSGSGIAVYGFHQGSGYGMYGRSAGGVGIQGLSDANGGIGIWGIGPGIGTRGDSTNGTGVYGESATGTAVLGNITATSTGIGVQGIATNGPGVRGSSGGGHGVHGSSSSGNGVYGFSSGNDGVVGQSSSGNHAAVAGSHTGSGTGVYGDSASGYAGYFVGDVGITGNLAKGSGTFKIDHPLDPANKYLSHSFVESPDMMNIYNGNVTLDKKGQATVKMPDYFSALNREFRYQLTAIGAPGPNLYVAQEITSNQFKVAGGKPGMKVSWQVTGVRKDAYANANRVVAVEEKKGRERGAYLHPELFGQPKTKGIGYAQSPNAAKAKSNRVAQQSTTKAAKK